MLAIMILIKKKPLILKLLMINLLEEYLSIYNQQIYSENNKLYISIGDKSIKVSICHNKIGKKLR